MSRPVLKAGRSIRCDMTGESDNYGGKKNNIGSFNMIVEGGDIIEKQLSIGKETRIE